MEMMPKLIAEHREKVKKQAEQDKEESMRQNAVKEAARMHFG